MYRASAYLLLCFAAFLTACQAPVKEEDIYNVPFTVIDSGAYSHLTLAKELVIRDNKEWKYLWLFFGCLQVEWIVRKWKGLS